MDVEHVHLSDVFSIVHSSTSPRRTCVSTRRGSNCLPSTKKVLPSAVSEKDDGAPARDRMRAERVDVLRDGIDIDS